MDYYPLNSYFSSDISDELDLSITNSVESLFSDIPEEESTNLEEVPIKKKRGRPPKPKVEQVIIPSTTTGKSLLVLRFFFISTVSQVRYSFHLL